MKVLLTSCIFLLFHGYTLPLFAMEKNPEDPHSPSLSYDSTHESIIEINGALQEKTTTIKQEFLAVWHTINEQITHISKCSLNKEKQHTFTKKKSAYLNELQNLKDLIEKMVVQKELSKNFRMKLLKKALDLYEVIHQRRTLVQCIESDCFANSSKEKYPLVNSTIAQQLQELIVSSLGTRAMTNEEYCSYLHQISQFSEIPLSILKDAIKNNASDVSYNRGSSIITLYLFAQRPIAPCFNVIPYFDRMKTFEKNILGYTEKKN